MMSSVWMNQLEDYSLRGGRDPNKWMWTAGQRAEESEARGFCLTLFYSILLREKGRLHSGNRNVDVMKRKRQERSRSRGKTESERAQRLWVMDGRAKGDKRRDKSVEEDSGRFQASVFPSVKTNGIMRGRPRPDGAQWEVVALSYGTAAGMCTGGPSCGNHCSVGRWAGAIRPPASHQLSSAAPSACVTHLSHHKPPHSNEQPGRWIGHTCQRSQAKEIRFS